jgi:hypothetical protein
MDIEIIIIILIVLFILYNIVINKKESYTSLFLPEILNKLPENKKIFLDRSYFLNDVNLDNNKYTLVNKDINKDINKDNIEFVYDNNKNVMGILSKMPSSSVYHFLLLDNINLDGTETDKINKISKKINDIIRIKGVNKPHFLYTEFPYETNNISGIFSILMIYYSGKILYNLGNDNFYYVNKTNDLKNYENMKGNNNLINIIKKYNIISLDIFPSKIDEKTKIPINFILRNFKYNKDSKEDTMIYNNLVFETYE